MGNLSNSHKKSDCQCDCVEELAEQLEKRRGDDIIVYERDGNQALGTIKEVKCGSVLILKNALKFSCLCGMPITDECSELKISICEITEFCVMPSPCTGVQRENFLKSRSGN
ncbi:hypothetical protein SAMN05428981_107127 [Bacillus sp. OV194]|nr:hypothetical protein SAMN05428981_107127 [Bacillus sp. OV194]